MIQAGPLSSFDSETRQLLEAVGYTDVPSLAAANADSLSREIVRANRMLKITRKTPDLAQVTEWIEAARDSLDREEREEAIALAVAEKTPRPIEPVEDKAAVSAPVAPFAIPLPGKLLKSGRIAVGEVPVAYFPDQLPEGFEIRVPGVTQKLPQKEKNKPDQVRVVGGSAPAKAEFDSTRVQPLPSPSGVRVPVSNSHEASDRVALMRAPLESTNRGKDPNSRRYIRGVLHTEPGSVKFAAVITLLMMICLPVSIVSGALLLLSQELPVFFEWVPGWLIWFPAALPVVGILYGLCAFPVGCKICRQKLFAPRACLKNSKAHHVPGLGYILPLSLHLLFFRWFRCTYCGTPVRLKK